MRTLGHVMKDLGVGLMLVVLLLGVPIAAIAIDYSAADNSAANTSDGSAPKGDAGQSTAAATGPVDAKLVIRHQKQHCHAWSYNADAYAADQTAQLAVGDKLTVTNNDVMGHKLIQLSGPTATITTAAMDKVGATSTITFTKPGTYVLGTKPGEDYTNGIVTTGEDNVLKMTVVVHAAGAAA